MSTVDRSRTASRTTGGAGDHTTSGGRRRRRRNVGDAAPKGAGASVADNRSGNGQSATVAAAGAHPLPSDYRPVVDEPYMNPRQLAYFRHKLLDWRKTLAEEFRQTVENMRSSGRDVTDEAEHATREAETSLELRAQERYRKLLAKIDQALRRVDDGTYGYCEETGEPIGIERLEARPIATLSVEAQARHERLDRRYGAR